MYNRAVRFIKDPMGVVSDRKTKVNCIILLKCFLGLLVVKGIGNVLKLGILFCSNPIANSLKDTWVMDFVMNSSPQSYSVIDTIILGIVIYPIIEELIFRAPLVLNKIWLSFSMALLYLTFFSGTSLNYIVSRCDWGNLQDVKSVAINILISIAIYYVLSQLYSRYAVMFGSFYAKYYNWLLYVFCSLFALGHLFNVDITYYSLMLAPVFVLPYFFSALFFSYVRLKYGLLHSILIHIMTNGLLIGFFKIFEK